MKRWGPMLVLVGVVFVIGFMDYWFGSDEIPDDRLDPIQDR